jgi:crossover junction endodeoxyribonuclease RuvC
VVVIEWLPQFDGHGDMSLRLAELHGVVKHYLWLQKVPVADVRPPDLKIYATGKGNATKTQVRAAMTARIGRLVHIADDNQADATCLLSMALDAYGEPLDVVPDTHRRALKAVRWPELPVRPEVAAALAGAGKAGA